MHKIYEAREKIETIGIFVCVHDTLNDRFSSVCLCVVR